MNNNSDRADFIYHCTHTNESIDIASSVERRTTGGRVVPIRGRVDALEDALR